MYVILKEKKDTKLYSDVSNFIFLIIQDKHKKRMSNKYTIWSSTSRMTMWEAPWTHSPVKPATRWKQDLKSKGI